MTRYRSITHTHALSLPSFPLFFILIDPATTEIYTLSLHDALPIFRSTGCRTARARTRSSSPRISSRRTTVRAKSEEHTSELQSHVNLVCRLLLEKKKKIK